MPFQQPRTWILPRILWTGLFVFGPGRGEAPPPDRRICGAACRPPCPPTRKNRNRPVTATLLVKISPVPGQAMSPAASRTETKSARIPEDRLEPSLKPGSGRRGDKVCRPAGSCSESLVLIRLRWMEAIGDGVDHSPEHACHPSRRPDPVFSKDSNASSGMPAGFFAAQVAAGDAA